MKNLEGVHEFFLAKAGEGITFEAEGARKVRLELNTEGPSRIAIQTGPETIRFLADVDGRQTLLFSVPGPFTLWPTCEGEVQWWSSEFQATSVALPDAKTFTKIAERRARNPEVERVARKMQENADRRNALLLAEVRGLIAAKDGEISSLKAEKKPVEKPSGTEVVPEGDGAKPAAKGAKAKTDDAPAQV